MSRVPSRWLNRLQHRYLGLTSLKCQNVHVVSVILESNAEQVRLARQIDQGRLSIESAPGRGTVVAALIPVSKV